jgi:hypothetical protein
MSRIKSRIVKAAAVAGVVLSFGVGAASPASAQSVVVGGGAYCNDFGMCNAPRYTVYYSYDWYFSGDRLRQYQLRVCHWVSPAGYVYALSFC